MKKHLIVRMFILCIAVVCGCTGLVFAESEVTRKSPSPAVIEFSATEPEDDIVELKLTVKDACFMGLQAAVRYDSSVLAPVNEDGETASRFIDFTTMSEQAAFFNEIGLELDAEKGLFGFCLYIMPGEDAEGVNEEGEYVADSEGIDLYTFRFKKLKDEDYSFEIAEKDDKKPYQPALKEGFIFMTYADTYEADVSFVYEREEKESFRKTYVPAKREPVVNVPANIKRKQNVICLQIGKNEAIVFNKKVAIDEGNKNVVPYITNDRTLVPLRFVSENLGAEVIWDKENGGCIVKKDETEVAITFGSAEFTVNGEKVTYDAPIEVVEDRTMVPIRFVSETLGYDVYWNAPNQAVVVSPIDDPWVEGREAEKLALIEMLVTLLPIM